MTSGYFDDRHRLFLQLFDYFDDSHQYVRFLL